MIRFSLVIHNNKDEFLVCECPSSDDSRCYEFLGGEIDSNILLLFQNFLQLISEIVRKKVAVEVCELQMFELYWRENPLWVHAMFTAKIKSGTPTKNYYKKLLWLPLDKIDIDTLNIYGIQVFRKIDECSYCHFLHEKKAKLDEFFENYFFKKEENLAILDALDSTNTNSSIYMLAFKQEMIHLRASLIESTNRKKNITIQNYFRLYGRNDLAESVEELLQINVGKGLSLRELIKESVDKFIAHYDNPSDRNKEIYDYCVSIFSIDGKLPLKEFIHLLNGYIMSLVIEMWYDAGELGVSMSNRCSEGRQIIIEHRNMYVAKIVQALKSE